MPSGDLACGVHARLAASRGFTFVWMLAALVVVSLGLAQVGPLWARQVQRDREAELLRLGKLYAEALDGYRRSAPGTLKRYPETLDDLLKDERFLGTRRWMRKAYPDPMRPGQPWRLVRDEEGRISGVYSASQDMPLQRTPVDLGITRLPEAMRYSDWVFTPETRTDKSQPKANEPLNPTSNATP
jgi:type II secretory pathway pseudopilin PulG